MQTFARKLNLIALALGAALTAPGCATDWFSSSSSKYVAGELSQDVENLPDPNAPPTPPKRPAIVSPLGAPFKESPDRLLLQANAYFEQGKFHDSARLYQKYLATPEAATAPPTVLGQARYRIAVVARKKMNFAEAKREFELALRHEPQNQQYRFDLGKSAFDGADYATADAAFSALIAQNPNYPQAQYYYGLTLLEGTRRAEAIAPLTKAVGELEAAALLTDKYYAIGETANAAAWEAQTTQIAARLGHPVPAFPNKPAFAPSNQPQNLPQTAQVAQTQAPVNCAPNADQPQNLPQTAQIAQTQAPVSIAPNGVQPQNLPQTAQVAQTQAPVSSAPNADQPQNLPQTAQIAQTQGPAPFAPNADQPQNLPQTAQVAQTQGPAPFAAPVAPPTSEESVSPVETLVDAAPLENAPLVNVEPSVLAAATPGESASQNNKQKNVSGTLTSQADDSAVSSSVAASQNPENAQNLTAHIGRRNPGLFAAPAASNAKIDFRPGSISTTAPLVAQNAPTTQDVQIAQNAPTTQDDQLAPNALTPQDAQVAQTAPIVGPQLPETSRFNVETAFRLVDRLVDLENCVAEYFAPLAPLYETAPSPFQVVEPEELYAAAPSPVELEDAEDEEFDENDDFAFASSGTSQPQPTAAPVAAIGGFGSYQAPTFDATSAFAAPIPAQNSAEVQTTQVPSVPQNAQIANLPQVVQTTQVPSVPQNAQIANLPQAVQTTQVPSVPQNVQIANLPQVVQTTQVPSVPQNAQIANLPQVVQTMQVPSVPQNAQIANLPQAVQTTQVPQYAAPTAPRRPSTSEERLQAAIAAGAEVREISPEEYRRAVSVGMSGQAQPR